MEMNIETTHLPDEEQEAKNIRYGIVFSGGGIKFATHAGMIDEMSRWTGADDQQAWLNRFRVLVGTSAGALYSACYAAGYSPAHVVFLAELISSLGRALFDFNGEGAAAAFLEHSTTYFRGGIRGFKILCLLETVLSHAMLKELRQVDPQNAGVGEKQALLTKISKEIEQRMNATRNRDYYTKLINFDDIYDGGKGFELFLLGVNAFTGQKTVFCRLDPNEADRKKRDDDEDKYSRPNYLNSDNEIRLAVNKRQEQLQHDTGDPTIQLNFRRFENRIYRQFDPKIYGEQFPVALAVRSSVSIPIIFAPPSLQRGLVHDAVNRREQDIFFDGGVDDNFSLSVASDPTLGNCAHILGIFLGNLGYRLPDYNVVGNAATILFKATDYLGDAVLDQQRVNEHLTSRHITAISAMTQKDASVTDTQQVPALIQEGRDIAKDFYRVTHGALPPPSGAVVVDSQRVFQAQPGEYIYLSPAAISGAESLDKMKGAAPWLHAPNFADVFTRLLNLIGIGGHAAPAWRWVYVALFFLILGSVNFLGDIIRLLARIVGSRISTTLALGALQIDWRILEVILALVLIIVLRIVAYWIYSKTHAKSPIG